MDKKTGGKPFVRWDDLDTVLFGNDARTKAGSNNRPSLPVIGEISLSNRSYSELTINEYRRLVYESYKYFVHLHSQLLPSEDMKTDRITPAEGKKICLLFAELLQSVLCEKLENITDERDQQFCTEIKVFEMFFSLSSFVIFGGCDKQGSSSGLCYELAEWIKVRQPCGEQMREACLKVTPPNRAESFWPAVYSLIIVGDLYGAVHLLRLHESSHLPDFAAVIELIEAFARLHADLAGLAEECDNGNTSHLLSPGYGGKSLGSANQVYLVLRGQWHSLTEAAHVIGERMLTSSVDTEWRNKLLVIVDLLAGKEAAFSDLKPYCDAWYQILVPRLLYVDPFLICSNVESTAIKTPTKMADTVVNDITKHAKWCLCFYFGPTPALSPSDSLFYSLFTRDLAQLTKGIGENFSNWWLLAHLLDVLCLSGTLLERGGWLVSNLPALSLSKQPVQQMLTLDMLSEIRNFALLEYALSLANDNDLWPISAGYLVETVPTIPGEAKLSSNPNGAELASFLIRRAVMRFPHEETLTRALDVTNRLNLINCYTELCVAEANRLFNVAKTVKPNNYEMQGCKKEWLLVAALSWAARPGDNDLAREAADSIVCELLTGTSCKILTDTKASPIWESLYMTVVGLLTTAKDTSFSQPTTLPFLNLAVRLYELHKATPETGIDLLSKLMTNVVSAGMLSESREKAETLNGLLALELRSILQNLVSSTRDTRLSDSFLLTLAKCVRDVSCLTQQQTGDNDLNTSLMIVIRQNTSSW